MHSTPLNRRALLQAGGAAAVGAALPMAAASPALAQAADVFTNPLAEQRADPHVWRHSDGYYYFTASVPEYDRIVMRRATTLQGLATASETTIWTRLSSGEMSHHAPSLPLHRRSTTSTGTGTSTSRPGGPTTSGRSGCTCWRTPVRTR